MQCASTLFPFQPPFCSGPPTPVSPPVFNDLQVSLVRLPTCPLVFHLQFGLHSAMSLPPLFQSPVFILAFPLQQSSTLILVSCSAVGFPCPRQPLLCGQTPMLDLASTLSRASHTRSSLLLCHGPSTLGFISHLVLGLNSHSSLPCSVWFPLCVQPPTLCLASSLPWASYSWSGQFLPGGPALSVWPLLPCGPSPAFPPGSFSGRGRTLCCGRLSLPAAPQGARAEPLLRVWWGRAMPAAPRASRSSWQQEPGTGQGGTAGSRVAAGAGAVVLKSKPVYAGRGAGTARGSSCLHGAEINLYSLQASKLEKQSSVSESDYDNPTTPLELEETG